MTGVVKLLVGKRHVAAPVASTAGVNVMGVARPAAQGCAAAPRRPPPWAQDGVEGSSMPLGASFSPSLPRRRRSKLLTVRLLHSARLGSDDGGQQQHFLVPARTIRLTVVFLSSVFLVKI